MMNRHRFLVSYLMLIVVAMLLTACHSKVTHHSVHPVTLLNSVRTSPRAWLALSGTNPKLTDQSQLTGLFAIQGKQATTYMLPETHPIRLGHVTTYSTQQLITWARTQDQRTYNESVRVQQARLTTKINHLQQRIQQLQAQSNSITALQAITELKQERQVTKVIRDNPQRYFEPTSYPLSATLTITHHHVTGETFTLKAFPVMTIQYGDANLITTSPQLLTSRIYNHCVGPVTINGQVYVGYRARTENVYHWLLTPVAGENYRTRFDYQVTNRTDG